MIPYKAIIAMLCVTGLLTYALSQGIDGLLLSAGVAVIAGLGGFTTGRATKK